MLTTAPSPFCEIVVAVEASFVTVAEPADAAI
jgi:hypothetical protein